MENKEKITQILRVNHAGEFGARQIYRGMMRVLGEDTDLAQMADQEENHLKAFTQLMIENKIKPTLFQPIWHILSYGIGVTTSLISKKAAHACTIAVEEVIVDHYQQQIDAITGFSENSSLISLLDQFRSEEDHHKKIAEEAGGRKIIYYNTLEKIIKNFTKIAIKISRKI